MSKWSILVPMLAVGVGACGSESPTTPTADPILAPSLAVSPDGSHVTGGGQFTHPTFGDFTFGFTAKVHADGKVTGRWQFQYFITGQQFKGDVTCLAVDVANGRAWIGGVITHAVAPALPIQEVGREAWFRVLDNPEAGSSDRTTLIGFEGGAGILTSEEYCAAQPWPDNNDRTWPVVGGQVTIH